MFNGGTCEKHPKKSSIKSLALTIIDFYSKMYNETDNLKQEIQIFVVFKLRRHTTSYLT